MLEGFYQAWYSCSPSTADALFMDWNGFRLLTSFIAFVSHWNSRKIIYFFKKNMTSQYKLSNKKCGKNRITALEIHANRKLYEVFHIISKVECRKDNTVKARQYKKYCSRLQSCCFLKVPSWTVALYSLYKNTSLDVSVLHILWNYGSVGTQVATSPPRPTLKPGWFGGGLWTARLPNHRWWPNKLAWFVTQFGPIPSPTHISIISLTSVPVATLLPTPDLGGLLTILYCSYNWTMKRARNLNLPKIRNWCIITKDHYNGILLFSYLKWVNFDF